MTERRKDALGEFRMMTECQGYIMARRPGAAPLIFSRKEWDGKQTPEEYDEVKALWDRHLTP